MDLILVMKRVDDDSFTVELVSKTPDGPFGPTLVTNYIHAEEVGESPVFQYSAKHSLPSREDVVREALAHRLGIKMRRR
jgi:hypothetical protein